MSSVPPVTAVDEPAPGPSAWSRVALTFTSPTRAFSGSGLASSWWAAYVATLVFALAMMFTIGKTVGWETVTRNNIAASPSQQAKFAQTPPAQQQAQISMVARITQVSVYVASFLGPLIMAAIAAGLLLATFNFGMGAHARYGPLFSLYLFTALPQIIKEVLVILLLGSGAGRDTLLLNNPLGSNPAYYVQGAPHWLVALLTWFDVFIIWQIVLLIIGCAIVAKVPRGKAAAVVIGWAVFLMLITTGIAAA